ncbi:putative aminodeoxychorismate synthase, chloroplastic [Smittium mucronatum]|uniref:Putative aminodeoxychorismate synthase, chloroplastic n=1 Tax=Smittium mucronatum TaxID=133383 RepID=A0A1R0GV17_9FUNG|nr:putative aminodeoxychorismate synthase, chloroplastic [Smittium mucronatum]
MQVVKSKYAIHGQTSELYITEDIASSRQKDSNKISYGLFHGVPQNTKVVRYHSLVIDPKSMQRNIEYALGDELEVIAWSKGNVEVMDENNVRSSIDDREIMAIKHKISPIYGVQFHPEVITADYILSKVPNVLMDTYDYLCSQAIKSLKYQDKEFDAVSQYSILFDRQDHTENLSSLQNAPKFVIYEERIPLHKFSNIRSFQIDQISKLVFLKLYKNDPTAFILDNSKENLTGSSSSIIGSLMSPGRKGSIIKYKREDPKTADIITSHTISEIDLESHDLDSAKVSFFDFAQDNLIDPLCENVTILPFKDSIDCLEPSFDDEMKYTKESLNFHKDVEKPEFRCGWVGYFGYEMSSESDIVNKRFDHPNINIENSKTPDSMLSLSTQSIVVHKDDSGELNIYLYSLCVINGHPSNNASSLLFTDGNCDFPNPQIAHSWIKKVSEIINNKEFFENTLKDSSTAISNSIGKSVEIKVTSNMSKSEYIDKINLAKEFIKMGESYQLCLTNAFYIDVQNCSKDISKQQMSYTSYQFMRRLYFEYLRAYNPAPMGAFLYYPDSGTGGVELGLLSCSPEKFLGIKYKGNSKWVAQMKPIKGTIKKLVNGTKACIAHNPLEYAQIKAKFKGDVEFIALEAQLSSRPADDIDCLKCASIIDFLNAKARDDLTSDVKEFAENLMIVDLVRHDMATGVFSSIAGKMNPSVKKLINLESFASVYQLVSTIESAIDLPKTGERECPRVLKTMANCFPPGSMTGTPKIKSVELLSTELECGFASNCLDGRGVYSGCIGYISAYKAQMNWSVVIRTVVSRKQSGGSDMSSRFEIGAGGAITILSDPESEWSEVLTKFDSMFNG